MNMSPETIESVARSKAERDFGRVVGAYVFGVSFPSGVDGDGGPLRELKPREEPSFVVYNQKAPKSFAPVLRRKREMLEELHRVLFPVAWDVNEVAGPSEDYTLDYTSDYTLRMDGRCDGRSPEVTGWINEVREALEDSPAREAFLMLVGSIDRLYVKNCANNKRIAELEAELGKDNRR